MIKSKTVHQSSLSLNTLVLQQQLDAHNPNCNREDSCSLVYDNSWLSIGFGLTLAHILPDLCNQCNRFGLRIVQDR